MRFIGRLNRKNVHLDQTTMITTSNIGYALIGAGVAVALIFRMRKNRRRQAAKSRGDYHCLTATMPLGSDAEDDSIQNGPANGDASERKAWSVESIHIRRAFSKKYKKNMPSALDCIQ